jgi:hypothetical protein
MIASPVQQTSGGSRLPRDLLHSYSGTSCVSYLVVDMYADTSAINLIVWMTLMTDRSTLFSFAYANFPLIFHENGRDGLLGRYLRNIERMCFSRHPNLWKEIALSDMSRLSRLESSGTISLGWWAVWRSIDQFFLWDDFLKTISRSITYTDNSYYVSGKRNRKKEFNGNDSINSFARIGDSRISHSFDRISDTEEFPGEKKTIRMVQVGWV